MALEVIGAGFGRTGTLSTKAALETLGFGRCHHMAEVFGSPEQLAKWKAIVDGASSDWDHAFDGYRSCIDWPSTAFWRELVAYYPKAKVFVTTRPVEDWVRSMQATICKLIHGRKTQPSAHFRSVLDMANEIVAERTFGGRLQDPAALAHAYEQRIADVTAAVDPNRLLLFDVRDGWAPLCEFLEVPFPDGDFPSGNTKEEFWKLFSS